MSNPCTKPTCIGWTDPSMYIPCPYNHEAGSPAANTSNLIDKVGEHFATRYGYECPNFAAEFLTYIKDKPMCTRDGCNGFRNEAKGYLCMYRHDNNPQANGRVEAMIYGATERSRGYRSRGYPAKKATLLKNTTNNNDDYTDCEYGLECSNGWTYSDAPPMCKRHHPNGYGPNPELIGYDNPVNRFGRCPYMRCTGILRDGKFCKYAHPIGSDASKRVAIIKSNYNHSRAKNNNTKNNNGDNVTQFVRELEA